MKGWGLLGVAGAALLWLAWPRATPAPPFIYIEFYKGFQLAARPDQGTGWIFEGATDADAIVAWARGKGERPPGLLYTVGSADPISFVKERADELAEAKP